VTADDITVESNTETAAEIRANFGVPEPVVEPPAPEEPEEPEVPEVPAPEPEAASVEPPKIDKRTREGRKASIQAEIDELIATRHTTKRELEALQADLARLRADHPPTPPAATPASDASSDPEPTPDRFETYEQYVKAQAKWEARQEIQTALAAQQRAWETQQAEQAEARRQQTWRDRLARVKAATPDWDARFKAETPIDKRVIPYLTNQEDGPQLLLYLSEHPDLAQRLAGTETTPPLHPVDQIRELAKISARLEAATSGPAPGTPIASAAKPPIKPVGSSPQVTDQDDGSDDESVEQHIARENARERKAGRR